VSPYEKVHDRPANYELAKSMYELIVWINDEGTGNLKKDRALWTIRKGFSPSTGEKQWTLLRDAEAISENGGHYIKLPLFYTLLKEAYRAIRPDIKESTSETPFTDAINKRRETIKRNLEKLGHK